jgi:hypothetical protein
VPVRTEAEYAAALDQSAQIIWAGMSSLPATQAYAYLWLKSYPGLAAALAQGAVANPGVRRWVDKAAGEGSPVWMVSLGISGASVALGVWQLMQDKQLRGQFAAANQQEFGKFVTAQAEALGLPGLAPVAGSSSSPPPGPAS